MRVAVLGCGPAGLMAAHAAKVAGAKVDIYSRRRKSELFGCQYLHAPIPGMTDVAPVEVTYTLHGDVDGYRQKVYGDEWEGEVSPEDLIGNHTAWDIRRTYSNLWDEYGPYVFSTELSANSVDNFMEIDSRKFDLIISSVPRNVTCYGGHDFQAQTVWAVGDAPERGIFAPSYANRNSIICNGLLEPSWYRAANVFGYSTVEWPQDAPLLDNIGKHAPSQVLKPLSHNCDCWPEIMNVGRYGKWQKGVLSHHAYQEVLDALVVESVR